MLANRKISSELSGSYITVKATRGFPQDGVLSPLLWSLVVDELLNSLERRGFEVVGYADDVVIIVRGKFESVIVERMQSALNHTFSWRQKEQLGVNPTKTSIIPFTKPTSETYNKQLWSTRYPVHHILSTSKIYNKQHLSLVTQCTLELHSETNLARSDIYHVQNKFDV